MAARLSVIRSGPALLALALLFLGSAAALTSCDDEAGADTESIKIKGTWFHLETALTPQARQEGLGGRDFIADNGGMLFVFPTPQRLAFVMRHCPVPIDVAFLDQAGRVLVIHEMTPEKPQEDGESDSAYEQRLKQYPSRFPAQFAVETAGGRLSDIGLEAGDVVDLDLERLKRAAR